MNCIKAQCVYCSSMQYELNVLNNQLGRVLLETKKKGMESAVGRVSRLAGSEDDRGRELVDNVLEGDFREFSNILKQFLSFAGHTVHVYEKDETLHCWLEPAGGGDGFVQGDDGRMKAGPDGDDILSMSARAVDGKFPEITFNIGLRDIGDVYLLWGGRVDEDFAYKHDVKTVVLTPSCKPGAGGVDEHTFFWDGMVSFRSNGEEVYSHTYDVDFVPVLSYAFMAFVFAPVDIWVGKRLYSELNAKRWLHTPVNWRTLYDAQQ